MLRGLVVTDAGVIARPPIGAAGGVRSLAKPGAVVAVGVVVGTVDPDPDAVPEDPMTAMVVEVVAVVAVALGKATMIGPVTVAVVMAAVAIEGLGIATTDIASRSRAIDIAAGVRPGTTVDVARTVVGERARAARDAA